MKKLLSGIVVSLAVSAAALHGFAVGTGVFVDDCAVLFDTMPIEVNDRTLVPARAIFETLGAQVNWDEATETVTAEKDNNVILLAIGSDTMTKNNVEITLDAPAMMHNDRTLIPIRAISEAFDCQVNWDEATETVRIYTPQYSAKYESVPCASLEELNTKLDTYSVAELDFGKSNKSKSYGYIEKYNAGLIVYTNAENTVMSATFPESNELFAKFAQSYAAIDSYQVNNGLVEVYSNDEGSYLAAWSCNDTSKVYTRLIILSGSADNAYNADELKKLVESFENNHPGKKTETSLKPVF